MTEERFDLVNEEGVVIGNATRRECHGNPALLHPVVHIMIRNAKGELLLQKRHPDKDIQPDRWDTSVGGHVDAGESIEGAVLRELREEVGISVSLDALTPCYRYIMRNSIESELVTTYALTHDGPFTAQPEEITALRFWSVEEICRRLGSGDFTPNFEDEFARYRNWENTCKSS
ncbi:MAG: NUDIX hydrolase [Planctomycetota bacterium]|jgi:isopentenyldiphosphate isomerase